MNMNVLLVALSIVIVSLIFIWSFYFGNGPDVLRVCCHSFGFGSEMKRCCDKYEWTAADGCKVPEGMVGGGKEVVDNSYCA